MFCVGMPGVVVEIWENGARVESHDVGIIRNARKVLRRWGYVYSKGSRIAAVKSQGWFMFLACAQ